MGLLKKIFKPVSKVLDKIVPNEIKPFLPYAAAFAPMFGPTSALFGKGIMQRALLSGGANIFGQLAQEGNEGDINLLSAGLGALSGAMTTPGGPGTYGPAGPPGSEQIFTPDKGAFQNFTAKGIERFGADSAMGEILTGASKASKFMTDPGLLKYGIPAAQGTGDLMFAQAKRDQDEYDRMMEEDAASDAASDAQRAFAIRRAMEAYGATEEEIQDAIYAAGYKTGGRVGFDIGGEVSEGKQLLLNKKYVELLKEYSEAGLSDADSRALKEANEFIRDLDFAKGGRVGFSSGDYVGSSDNETIEDEYDSYIKEIEIDGDTPMSFSSFKKMIESDYAKGGRVGFDSGGGLMDTVVGMFKKEDKGPDFGGITEAVKNIEEKPKEVLVDKLKVTIEPGQSEMRAIIEAMYNDVDGVMPDDRKNQFYELYSPQMYRNGEMDKAEFEFIQTEILGKEIPKMAEGGLMKAKRGLVNEPGGYAGYKLNDFALDEDLFNMSGIKRYYLKDMSDDGETYGVDEVREMLYGDQYASGGRIGAEEGGLMNLGGKEMDMRGGGFIPIGKKERADDVPARLSKNEFVMTADAVRAAGGGSVNEGAKRMYETMNKLEARA